MSDMGFSLDWLDLREPVDHLARDPALRARAVACLDQGQRVLDLGSGSGSTARAFEGRVPNDAWRFVDADADLLRIVAQRHPGSQPIPLDLRHLEDLPLDGVGLVTASALLDLMPAAWIEALARRLAAAAVPFYAALIYNGQMAWTPALPDDAAITDAFNRHQRGDKGLGPAAGPDAARQTARLFRACGFEVVTGDSPWILGPRDAALHAALLDGIGAAAGEMGQDAAATWLDARHATLATTKALIGHTDLLALPC